MPAGVTGDPARGARALPRPRQGPVHGLPPGARATTCGRPAAWGPISRRSATASCPTPTSTSSSGIRASIFPNTVDAAVGRRRASSRPRRSSTSSPICRRCTGPVPAEKDPDRNPFTRQQAGRLRRQPRSDEQPRRRCSPRAPRRCGARAGPGGQGVRRLPRGRRRRGAMRGVATRYPKHVAAYGRVMSARGLPRPCTARRRPAGRCRSRARTNLDLTMLVKMASNGHAGGGRHVEPARRGRRWPAARRSFDRRVGERNHACADCHTPETRRQQVPGRPPARRRHRRPHAPLPDLADEPERRVGHAQADAVVHDAARA